MTTETKQPVTTQTQASAGANNAQAEVKTEVKPEVKAAPQAQPDVAALQAELKAKEEALQKAAFEIQNAYQIGQQEALRRAQAQPVQTQPQTEPVDENDPLGIKKQVTEVFQQDKLLNAYGASINQFAHELNTGWHPEVQGVDKAALDKFVLSQATQLADNPEFLPQLIHNPRERTRQAFNYAMANSPVKYVQVVTGQNQASPNISNSSNGQTDYGGQAAPSGSAADQIGSLTAQLQDAKAKALAQPTEENRHAVFKLSTQLQDAQRKT